MTATEPDATAEEDPRIGRARASASIALLALQQIEDDLAGPADAKTLAEGRGKRAAPGAPAIPPCAATPPQGPPRPLDPHGRAVRAGRDTNPAPASPLNPPSEINKETAP